MTNHESSDPGFTFEDPPPAKEGGRSNPALSAARDAARRNPGMWVKVPNIAASNALNLKKVGFEAVARDVDKATSRATVYLRWHAEVPA